MTTALIGVMERCFEKAKYRQADAMVLVEQIRAAMGAKSTSVPSPEPPPTPNPPGTSREIIQIARDFDRAFAVARLAPMETFVMQVAREQSYTMAVIQGKADPLPIRFNYADMARLSGAATKQISRSVIKLVTMHILEPQPAGTKEYRIQKDYSQWTGFEPVIIDGKRETRPCPLLTPEQVAWCQVAARHPGHG